MKIPETAKKLLDNTILALDGISMTNGANDLRKLRDDLDSQSSHIFDCEDEFEARTRFVKVIMQYQEFLGIEEHYKYLYSVNIQKQLMNALQRAKNVQKMKKEAENVIGFIQEAPRKLWADCEDINAQERNFKLIKDDDALEKISCKFRELPTDDFKGIRIFYKVETTYEKIRKEHLLREWKKICFVEYLYGCDPKWIFKCWYGIHDTGTYYVYVPKN